ncbi:MAG: succinoglycan biosynthesis protein [Phenylobacterium sp.]|nr:succinoglycan biosynthesis protein [Phenylobacterium sp.]
MLSPKPQGPTPSPRKSSRAGFKPRSFHEPRSFAPGARGMAGETQARWPGAWEALEPAAFIRLPDAAPTPQAAVEPDPRKRALIVIPTLNEARVIAEVVERVLDDDGLVDPLVVVADGGSTDETRDIVREITRRDPRVRLIDNPGRLQSAGLNLAAAAIAGDRPWLLRVDAHADYPRNYASRLIEEAMRTGATSVVVSMDTVGEEAFQRAVAAAQNSVLGTGGSAHRLASEGQWVDHGHHALFDLAAFEAVGGYDESFSHNEDAELDLRLARQGGRIWLTDKVRIGYYPRRAAGALWKQYVSYGKGRARTVLKHYTPLKIRQALPLAVAPAVAGLALAPLFWWLAIPAMVWALTALSFGAVLSARKRDAAILMSGPAAMIMHLGWSAGFWAQLITHGGERKVGDLLTLPRHAVS